MSRKIVYFNYVTHREQQEYWTGEVSPVRGDIYPIVWKRVDNPKRISSTRTPIKNFPNTMFWAPVQRIL